jgi:Na+/proline symporter
MFAALLLIQFIAGGKLFAAISGWSYPAAVLTIGIIILLYLIAGGFSSVVKTDAFQFLVMLTLVFVLLMSMNKGIGFEPQQYNLFNVGIGQIIGFTIMGFFVILISADVWQRAYASQSQKTLRRGFTIAGLLLLAFGLAITPIGIVAKEQFPKIVPEDALYHGLTYLFPQGLLGIALIFIFASIMSSADTCAFISSMNISRDIISRYRRLTKRKLVIYTRSALLVLIIIAIAMAVFIQDIINVIFSVVALGLSLGPALFGSLFWKLKERAVFYSIIIGMAAAGMMICLGTVGPEASIISFPIALITLIVGQVCFRR